MTVTYRGEIAGDREGTNNKGMRSYTRSFRLETSVVTEGPYAVGSHASLPVIGSSHPEDSGAWLTSATIKNTDPWKGWTYTAQYSSERELATDPTSDPAIITWDGEQFQKPAVTSYAGTAICNSAGDPFDPPQMIDDSRPVVTITKNMSSVPVWVRTYQDAVNSDVFTVDGILVAAGLAKIQRISISEKQARNGVPFRVLTMQVTLQKKGWLVEPLDAGFREINSGQRINIKNDGDNEDITAPVPLDGSGLHLTNPTVATSIYLAFTVYETLPFSALPFT